MSVLLTHKSDEFDDTGSMLKGRWSNITIDKSKISPEAKWIPMFMDSSQGGKISEVDSFVLYMTDTLQFIKQGGGWYNIRDLVARYKDDNPFLHEILESYNKSYRYTELVETVNEDTILYNLLRLTCMDYIRSHYALQTVVINNYYMEVYDELVELTEDLELEWHPNNAEEVIEDENESSDTEGSDDEDDEDEKES